MSPTRYPLDHRGPGALQFATVLWIRNFDYYEIVVNPFTENNQEFSAQKHLKHYRIVQLKLKQ